MKTDDKLRVLIAINEANKIVYDLMDKYQKEIEAKDKEIRELREILKTKENGK